MEFLVGDGGMYWMVLVMLSGLWYVGVWVCCVGGQRVAEVQRVKRESNLTTRRLELFHHRSSKPLNSFLGTLDWGEQGKFLPCCSQCAQCAHL